MISPLEMNLESIQALLILACYSDKRWLFTSLALRMALELRLPDSIEQLTALLLQRRLNPSNTTLEAAFADRDLLRSARTWCCIYILDQIFSLDGGKEPSIKWTSSPRRLRTFLNHPERTPRDHRLISQVELNSIRASAYAAISKLPIYLDLDTEAEIERNLSAIITGTQVDLDLWLQEWETIIQSSSATSASEEEEKSLNLISLHVQHRWAILTLHLKSLSASGIENIAAMTPAQCQILRAAKAAAEAHLTLLSSPRLSGISNPHLPQTPNSSRQYLSSFRYSMDFVWAKCAFSVLLVLRLSNLLDDPVNDLLELVRQARDLLNELEQVGGTEVTYYRILAASIDMCERAINASDSSCSNDHCAGSMAGPSPGAVSTSATEPLNTSVHPNDATSVIYGSEKPERGARAEFETFIPKEFRFDWDFPGLNLCHISLDWQNLFVDIGSLL